MVIRKLLLALLQVYSLLILVRVLLSWVNPNPRNDILLTVIRITEPVLGPFRAILPIPGFDLSPLVAWLLISFLMKWIAQV